MSCPFYAHSLMAPMVRGPIPLIIALQDPPIPLRKEWIFVGNPSSNQCALVTSSHSPCSMEVHEGFAPDWEKCPRNPEYCARIDMESKSTDEEIGRAVAFSRVTKDWSRLARNITIGEELMAQQKPAEET